MISITKDIFTILVFVNLSVNVCLSQVEFNTYTTVKSKGPIPSDFKSYTYEKVNKELSEHRSEIGSYTDQRDFIIKSRYSIDELLSSGNILFGDSISLYINSVSERLLVNKPELAEKLRFYPLKSNISNAFSTDQGIIFITTGLLARLESEAQLAFILAHEISHYTESHVAKSYVWQKQYDYSDNWIRIMSAYSQTNELEADRLAVELYKDAGYDKDLLNSVFTVLDHVQLNFEDIPYETDSLQRALIPSYSLIDFLRPLPLIENQEDSLSSHPSINYRNEALSSSIESGTWKSTGTKYLIGVDWFNYVRDVCRRESVRQSLLNGEYGNALYSIFLLRKHESNEQSLFLDRMELHAWLGIYRNRILKTKIEEDSQDLQGYQGTFLTWIENLSLNEVRIYSTLLSHDLLDQYGNDELKALNNKLFEYIRIDTDFHKAIRRYIIEQKSEITSVTSDYSSLDAIRSIILNDNFLIQLDRVEQNSQSDNRVNSFIGVPPRVIAFNEDGIDLVRSEKFESSANKSLEIASNSSMMTIKNVVFSKTTMNYESYNELSTLHSYLMQLDIDEKITPVPIDYMDVAAVNDKYGSSKVIFTVIAHNYHPRFENIIAGSLGILFPPWGFVYVTNAVISGNSSSIFCLVVDLESGETLQLKDLDSHEPLNKYLLANRISNILNSSKKP